MEKLILFGLPTVKFLRKQNFLERCSQIEFFRRKFVYLLPVPDLLAVSQVNGTCQISFGIPVWHFAFTIYPNCGTTGFHVKGKQPTISPPGKAHFTYPTIHLSQQPEKHFWLHLVSQHQHWVPCVILPKDVDYDHSNFSYYFIGSNLLYSCTIIR